MVLRSKLGGQVLEFQKTTCSCLDTPFHQDKVCLQGWKSSFQKGWGAGGSWSHNAHVTANFNPFSQKV